MVTLTCFLCNKSNNEDCSFLFRNARIYYVLTVTARQKVTSGLDLCSHRTRATGIIDFTVHCPNRKKRNVVSQLRKNYFILQSEMKHPSFFFSFFPKTFSLVIASCLVLVTSHFKTCHLSTTTNLLQFYNELQIQIKSYLKPTCSQ